MSSDSKDLSIKGESIQSLYGFYLSKQFLVNRRYQRKLVWSIDEKRSFIDSIINKYPVPLILLADVITEKGKQLEIIDGMQRLNAIMSFIDQEFDINGSYFDLDTMADTKLLKDQGRIVQKENKLDRSMCADIVRYQIPLSIFQESGTSHIDEVFRRLNSGGKHLSKQELRQAGALSRFATIVRKLSSNVRGDSSSSDILDLNSMKNISITNKNLDYGISVEEIFWVKNNIISREDLRQSKDEEVIADIVAWVSLSAGTRSSSDILNQLYGYNVDGEDSLAVELEREIQKINEEKILYQVQYVFDVIIELTNESGKTFNALLFDNQQARIARYFQIVFFALYKLLVEEEMQIVSREKLLKHFDKAGDKLINLSSGGGIWSAKEKQNQTNAFAGIIKGCFEKTESNDPALQQWITRFENIIRQSSTEQTLYDFKVGLHQLAEEDHAFNSKLFSKIIKTLTAMANTLKNAVGYCVLGVADTKSSAEAYMKKYQHEAKQFSDFYITGINGEADRYHAGTDKYFTKLTQLLKNEPISDTDKDYISRNIAVVNYFDKTVIIFKIESGDQPSIYDGKYFVRHGSNINEVKAESYGLLYDRFRK